MDLTYSCPAYRGSKLTTTALIHSSSPPGFIANQKELSTRGKVKAHNGCVVTENDKIILLKRVYTSPVRRSSRVRRKGCLVASTPMPKRRHSVPAHTVTVNSQQTRPKCCPKSAGSVGAVNGQTRKPSSVSSLSNLTSPPTSVPEGVQWLDETPRRRLSVRITETAEIRKKLAEAGMPRLSLCADPEVTPPGPQNYLSEDDNDASSFGFGDGPCERKEGHPELSKHDTRSMFDPSRYLGSVFPDLQCTNSSLGSDDIDFGSKNVVGGELLSPSTSSLKSKRVNREEFMNGFFHAGSESSMELESVDSGDEFSRDAGDEVLCISPLPFEKSEMNCSFTPIQTEESRLMHLELPNCLLSDYEQHTDMDESLASPLEMSCRSSPASSISADASLSGSMSSRSPGSILRVDLGRNNPLSPLASPTGSQSRCKDLEYPSPRKNGMRPRGLLKISMSSPTSTSTSTDTSNIKFLEYSDQLTDDVCIVNLTPNTRVYNSLKDKEPSPTYASQANTESPSSPRNTSIVSEQNECKQNTPGAFSTRLRLKQNSPSVQLKSPECLSPPLRTNEANDFQDFSEFDFLASDESTLLAQATRQTDVLSKPVSPERVLSYSFNHLARSSDDGHHPQHQSDHLHCVQPSKESVEVRSLLHDQQQIENIQSYAPAYQKPSISQSIHGKDSDEVWTSAPDFRSDDFEAPSQKKNPFARRSSMRIAKRMSLLTAEVDNNKDDEKDSGKIMQLKTSELSTTEPSKVETMIVVKRKRGRPRKNCPASQVNNNHCLEQHNAANPIPSTPSMETQSTTVASNPDMSAVTLPVPGTEEQLKCQFDDDPKPNLVKRSRRKSRRCSARLHPQLLPLAAEDASSTASDLPVNGEVERINEKDPIFPLASPLSLVNSCHVIDESATTQLNTNDQEVGQDLPKTMLPSGRASKKKSGGTRKRRRSIRLLTATLNRERDAAAHSSQIPHEEDAKAPSPPISSNRDIKNTTDSLETDSAIQSNLEPCNEIEDVDLCVENVTFEVKNDDMYTSTHVNHLAEMFSLSPNNGLEDVSHPFYADLASSSDLGKASLDNSSEEIATSSRPRRRRSGVTLSSVAKREVKCKKRCGRNDEEAVKELYLKRGESKALKQSNLETIFEEVHIGKTGSPVYTTSRKCKRAVTFLEHPWLPRKRKKQRRDKMCPVKRKKKSPKDPNIDKKLEALLADLTLSPTPPFASL